MTGDEDQLAGCGALRAPLEKIVGVEWLSVVVHAKQRHIEVIARIGEVIRIAAIKSGLLLRRKYQPDIRVRLVLIEPVFAAVVKRHHVGAKPGLVFALFGDRRDLCLACLQRLRIICNAFGCALHSRRYVLHSDQNVDLKIRRLHLLVRCRCIETR